jgi:hypothetical protein
LGPQHEPDGLRELGRTVYDEYLDPKYADENEPAVSFEAK